MGSKHKELTPWRIKTIAEHVKNWNKNCVDMHGIDPFSNDAPRHLTTGKIKEAEIISDIIQAPELLVSQYKAFINDRPFKGTVSSIPQ